MWHIVGRHRASALSSRWRGQCCAVAAREGAHRASAAWSTGEGAWRREWSRLRVPAPPCRHWRTAFPGRLQPPQPACLAEDFGEEAALGDAAPPALSLEAELALRQRPGHCRCKTEMKTSLDSLRGCADKVSRCTIAWMREKQGRAPAAALGLPTATRLVLLLLLPPWAPLTWDSPLATGGSWWKSPDRMSCRQGARLCGGWAGNKEAHWACGACQQLLLEQTGRPAGPLQAPCSALTLQASPA